MNITLYVSTSIKNNVQTGHKSVVLLSEGPKACVTISPMRSSLLWSLQLLAYNHSPS